MRAPSERDSRTIERGDDGRVTECAEDLLTSVENLVSYTVTEPALELARESARVLAGELVSAEELAGASGVAWGAR